MVKSSKGQDFFKSFFNSLFIPFISLFIWTAPTWAYSHWEIRALWVTPPQAAPLVKARSFHQSVPQKLTVGKKSLVIFTHPSVGVIAVDDESGARHWSFPIKFGSEVGVAVEGDYVFASGNDGNIYCLDGGSGRLIWSFPTRTENFSELVLHRGTLFAITASNVVYALEALSGKLIWLHSRPELPSFSVRGQSRPALYKDMIITAFSDGSVVALDQKTGAKRWEQNLIKWTRFRDLDLNIFIHNDLVLVGSIEENLYALEAKTGIRVWSLPATSWGQAALVGKEVCLATLEKKLTCLNVEKGQLTQDIFIAKGRGQISSPAVLDDNTLLLGTTEGALYVLDKQSSSVLNHFYPGRGVYSPPMVEQLSPQKWNAYFVSGEGYLYKLELKKSRRKKDFYLKFNQLD